VDPERLAAWERELESVLRALSDAAAAGEHASLRDLTRRHRQLESLVDTGRRLHQAEEDSQTAREMLKDASAEDREMLRSELERSEAEAEKLEQELRLQLVPSDPNEGRNVIVEIRGAEGGEEANLFARDLFEMYRRYVERHNWRLEVLSADYSDRDGINEITFVVRGEDAWRRLKHEGGPHRVQRVPVTESQGRIHTSAATVMVLPEAEEIEVKIDPADLRVDVFRSTGPGGQSVNTTDSAVRITHVPTGMVVSMQDEKSQIQNRAKAMQVLRARLLKLEQDKVASEQSDQRRSQVGGGGRSEKIRTYNFKENRVTDHRIKLTLHKLDRVLDGEIDELVDGLLAAERDQQIDEGGAAAAGG